MRAQQDVLAELRTNSRSTLVLGVAISSAGMLYVFLLLNALTVLLGLLTLISYLSFTRI